MTDGDEWTITKKKIITIKCQKTSKGHGKEKILGKLSQNIDNSSD